jgi:protoheme IX farnesyltransferase
VDGTKARDLLALTKPRITVLVLVTAAVGLWLAPARPGLVVWVTALVGTALAAASASVLNCWLERDRDGLMERTRDRPLPAGRVAPSVALRLGLGLGVVALALLAAFTGPWPTALGGVAIVGYVGLYTPLKPRTPLALVPGAVCGALPPAMGWTAATGTLDAGAVILFGILFLWQFPHFLAIAVLRAADYERAGMRVFSVTRGRSSAARAAAAWTVALVAGTLTPLAFGMAGIVYGAAALALGAWLLVLATRCARAAEAALPARRLLFGTLAYLPVLLVALMFG